MTTPRTDRTTPAADAADVPEGVTDFIARWTDSAAAERANYALFLSELCDVLGVGRPHPSRDDDRDNAYVFERHVRIAEGDGTTTTGRIDLYKRGCFVLEAKQGSAAAVEDDGPGLFGTAERKSKKRGTAVRGTAGWDEAMEKARGQAERYVRALPPAEGNPPFLVVVDVGHTLELYAEFSRLGRTYTPFPDARSHRIALADLARPDVRARLAAVWTDPLSLDPTRRSAKVTREVADRLAKLAKSFEAAGRHPEQVADFLMRCIFTFFAEDVNLIKDKAFTKLLKDLRDAPENFGHMVQPVWREMDKGTAFSPILKQKVLHFNGGLFEHSDALPVDREQLALLIEAAERDWADVEPAIFGTLLERALSPDERHKLGAHYTPRAYVERLVLPTVIEPLREQFDAAKAAAFTLNFGGDPKGARAAIGAFLDDLARTTVLDPACGSGNFLYVTKDHMKRLEEEARDVLRQLGQQQEVLEFSGLTVDPHQFLGLELNPRAVAIADLVLWIGYLQFHYRAHGSTTPA
ncbi:MAG TPA: type IIL restriction-modification enzyme MmeI, partial [Humisphaera sp.]